MTTLAYHLKHVPQGHVLLTPFLTREAALAFIASLSPRTANQYIAIPVVSLNSEEAVA